MEDGSEDQPQESFENGGGPLLQLFVAAANAGELEAGITLWVEGLLVSGTLVALTDYLSGVGETIKESTGTHEGLPTVFSHFADEAGAERDGFEARVSFIHLRDAQTYQAGGNPIPSNQGVWWRGLIEKVDGWCFGTLAVG